MYQVQKRRRSGWFYFVLFLCAFAIGLGIGYAGIRLQLWRNNAEATPEGVVADRIEVPDEQEPDRAASAIVEAEAEPEQEPKETFFVKAQSGKVCVFTVDEAGSHRFSHNLAIELDALREADKKLFYDGIAVSSKEELLSLVEDFSS